MTKAELRKYSLARRMDLSEGELAQLNFNLYQSFFSGIDLSFTQVLHVFLPIASKREPDTWPIIDRIRREFPHIRISIPKVNSATGVFESFYFEGMQQLSTSAWGIQEPTQGTLTLTPPEKIDRVLIPLLAYDQAGHRVGYGKGFYDKFLVTCRPDCIKTGLSLFHAEKKIDDTSSFDIKMDECVYPGGVDLFS